MGINCSECLTLYHLNDTILCLGSRGPKSNILPSVQISGGVPKGVPIVNNQGLPIGSGNLRIEF